MAGDDGFHEHELESIGAGLTELASGQIVFQHPSVATDALLDMWSLAEPLLREAPEPIFRRGRVVHEPAMPLYAPPSEPAWDLGLTHEFRKAIRNIDRKLQGRVLQALNDLSTKPTVPRGNTVKPLSGEYEGLWRYRIGNYRLIYRPDTDNARVVLVTVVSRGSAYA